MHKPALSWRCVLWRPQCLNGSCGLQACHCQAGGRERQSCELVRSQPPNAKCYASHAVLKPLVTDSGRQNRGVSAVVSVKHCIACHLRLHVMPASNLWYYFAGARPYHLHQQPLHLFTCLECVCRACQGVAAHGKNQVIHLRIAQLALHASNQISRALVNVRKVDCNGREPGGRASCQQTCCLL